MICAWEFNINFVNGDSSMTRSLAQFLRLSVLAAAVMAPLCGAVAADRSGREVVNSVCAACHATGIDGAPKIGDFGAWAKRAEKGFDKLTENAIAGTGKMPAHGGQSNLSDLELSRAIAFMASGGRADDPKKSYASPSTITGEKLVGSHCISCHGKGLNGAPKIDNFDDWKPRLQKGIEPLVQSAVNGHNAMPSRAGLGKLSDTDLRNAIIYMVIQSSYKPKG